MNPVTINQDNGSVFLIDDQGRVRVNSAGIDNALFVQCNHPNGYSAEQFNDHENKPRLTIGHGNAGSFLPNTSYIATMNAGGVVQDFAIMAFDGSSFHDRIRVKGNGDVVIGGEIPTDAAHGHLVIPSCAGTPTGNAPEGSLVRDSVNHKLYMRSGGSWIALN